MANWPLVDTKIKNEEQYVVVATTCPSCGSRKDFDLRYVRYEEWRKGALIQNVFPDLSRDDRERLITGTCNGCWDAMWKAMEEE